MILAKIGIFSKNLSFTLAQISGYVLRNWVLVEDNMKYSIPVPLFKRFTALAVFAHAIRTNKSN
jgi:hypothetical protein